MLGDHDLTRPGQAHEPCGEIDTATKHIVGFNDDVADLHAYAEPNPAFRRVPRVQPLGGVLDGEGRRYRRPDLLEIQKHPIAEVLHEPPIARWKHMRPHVVEKVEPASDHADLVVLHEAH